MCCGNLFGHRRLTVEFGAERVSFFPYQIKTLDEMSLGNEFET